jgi:hypothetical protein
MPGMRWLLWLFAGFALYRFSAVLEGIGDSYPHAANGTSWDRLTFHGAALILLLAGLACFIRACVVIVRSFRGGAHRPSAPVAPGPDAPSAFDPDAALSRYLESKGEQTEQQLTRPRPPQGGGFGRRGL